jgi:hypothetical protein
MPELPQSTFEAARAMTRVLRRDTHPDTVAIRERRETLLARHGYTARVREDESGPVLVCYPEAWVEDGTFQPEELESTENAVEGRLSRAPHGDGWAGIASHNRELADRVAERFGEPHGETAAAFGTYMANHHESPVEGATATEIEDFRHEYFPRNAWPSAAQREAVATSLRHLFAVAGEPFPTEAEDS